MPRRMRDPRYRAEQWKHRYAEHVEPLNQLVDELGESDPDARPPYIAPMYRGVHARVLAILRDPGPKAGGVAGSGFLSIENDDQTAERQMQFFAEAGLDPAEVVPWNAYPWYINAAPTKDQLRRGIEPLRRVVDLMTDLRVVLLAGKDAQAAWRLFTEVHGATVMARRIRAVETYHPSRQALQHPDPAERARREDHIRAALRRVAAHAGTSPRPAPSADVAVERVPARTHVPLAVLVVDVAARPATFATAGERPWRAAVAAAVGSRDVPAGSRFAVELEFRLPAPATRNDGWDLDNLIKPTLDALGGVLGWRRWQGMPQADDECVDRIVASKRTAGAGEIPGARIRIVPLSGPNEGADRSKG
ncbi:uracil-DNA glycosylase family protein [Pseudonocardia pini]|uniref:uracil-DNA glycosylase family protein n=1 Tax=Pseudonocardia pini TaxID=2758030 RepID=UPI0015F0B493|nr:uracil-DNA glycosylase family protein [Pseudonocardia pini]